MKPGEAQHELYLSTHRDANTRESVLGHCRVVAELGEGGHASDVHLCRYTFDIQKQVLEPVRMVEWTVRGPSDSESASAPGASFMKNVNIKKRRCKFPLVLFASPQLLAGSIG